MFDISDIKDRSEIFCIIGKVLTSSLNPGEVFKRVMKIIGDFFSPRNWSLLLMEENTGRLKFEIVMGVDGEKMKEVFIEKGEGIVGWVCLNGEPVVVEDAQNDPRFSPRVDQILGFTTRSVVCVPLLNGNNHVVGAIELINKIVPPSAKSISGGKAEKVIPTLETFTKTDMRILSSIGAFTGIAAENAFLHQKVRELAMMDCLTGISNRYYFHEILLRETDKVKRYGHTICMLMIDIDEFKDINDNFGHLVGDQVLIEFAEILKKSVRESDLVARFGGDEFVILMPFAGENEGWKLANRIHNLVIEWNKNSILPGLELKVSIGVHAAGPENVDDILSKTDQQLYLCKSFRKNPDDLTSEEEMRRYLWYNVIAPE